MFTSSGRVRNNTTRWYFRRPLGFVTDFGTCARGVTNIVISAPSSRLDFWPSFSASVPVLAIYAGLSFCREFWVSGVPETLINIAVHFLTYRQKDTDCRVFWKIIPRLPSG